jgi:hypothetical protein
MSFKKDKYRIISYLLILGVFVLFTLQSITQLATSLNVSILDIYSKTPYLVAGSVVPAALTIFFLFLINNYRRKKYSQVLSESLNYFYGGLLRIVSYTIILTMLLLWTFHLIFHFGMTFDLQFSNTLFLDYVLNRIFFSFIASGIIMIYLKVISNMGRRNGL